MKIILNLLLITLTLTKATEIQTPQKTETQKQPETKKNSKTRNLEGQVTITNNPPMPQATMMQPQKTRAVFNYNSYPLQMASPFNLHSFNNIFNPNQSHLSGSSPLHTAALGLHPFMSSGMSIPFMNPYMMMNPMMMGSMGGANGMNQMNIPGTAPFYKVNAAQASPTQGNRKMMLNPMMAQQMGNTQNPQGGMNPMMAQQMASMQNPQGRMNPMMMPPQMGNMQNPQGGMNPMMAQQMASMQNPQGRMNPMMMPPQMGNMQNPQGVMNPMMMPPQMGNMQSPQGGMNPMMMPPQMGNTMGNIGGNMQNFPGMDRSLTNNDKGIELGNLNNMKNMMKQKTDMEGIMGISKRGLTNSYYDHSNPQNSNSGLLGSIASGMPFAKMNQMLKMGIKPRKLKENPIV